MNAQARYLEGKEEIWRKIRGIAISVMNLNPNSIQISWVVDHQPAFHQFLDQLENAFGIEIPADQRQGITTLDGIVRAVMFRTSPWLVVFYKTPKSQPAGRVLKFNRQ